MKPWRKIAHRGAPRKSYENTLNSFKDAIAGGASYIEFDVQMTSDRKLVVYHDENLSRMIDGARIKIKEISAEALNSNFLGLPFKAPLVEDVLKLAAKHSIVSYVEIKTKDSEAVLKVLALAEKLNAKIVLSSFHHSHLSLSKEISPNIKTMALLEWYQPIPTILIKNGIVDELGVGDNFLTISRAKKAKQLQIPTYVFTVNEQERADELKEIGVQGVFTDTF